MSDSPKTPEGGEPDAAKPSQPASHRRRRPMWLRVLGGLFLLAFTVLLGVYAWISWYVNSGDFKNRLEERISDLAEVKVTIGSFVFIPWSTLVAWDVQVPTGDKAIPNPVVAIDRVEIDLDLAECFRGNWVVRSVDIRSPGVLLQENDKGKIAVEAIPESEDDDDKADIAKKDGGEETGGIIDFAVNGATISGGSLTYIDRQKRHTLDMQGIRIDTDLGADGGDLNAKGNVAVDTITLVQKLKITKMRTPLEIVSDTMKLNAIEASVFQGTLSGSASADLAKKGVPYSIKLKVKQLDTKSFISEMGGGSDVQMGTLDLTFDGGGRLDQASLIHGEGWMTVGPFHSKGVPVLGTLAKLAGVPALADIKFEKIRIKYKVEKETGVIEAMQTYPLGADIVVIGAGTVGFDGKINFQGEATIDSGLAGAINDIVKTVMLKSSEGFMTIPFTISGQATDPSVNITPFDVGGSVIRSILDFIPIVPTDAIFKSSLRKHVEEVFGEEGESPEDLRRKQKEAEEKKKAQEEEPPGANTGGVINPRNSPASSKGH